MLLTCSTRGFDLQPVGGQYIAQRCVILGQSLNLLSSILTILPIYPNSDTLVCYSNDPFSTVHAYLLSNEHLH